MPKFLVAIDYHASVLYEVEADNEPDAIEKAKAIVPPDDQFEEEIRESLDLADAWVVEEIKEGGEQ